MDQETINLFDGFSKSKKCLELRPDQLEMKILGCMKLASDLSKKQLTEGQIKTYIIEMIRDLKRNWEWLTVAELEYIMRQGAKGVYNDDGIVYDLSYRTIYNWLIAYRNSEERKSFLELKQKELEANQKSLQAPKIDRMEYLKGMTITAWNIFIKLTADDGFLMLPVEAFEYLESTGKIKMSNEEKRVMRENVLRFLRQRADGDKLLMRDREVYPFILTNESDEEQLKNACRKWAAGKYFRSLIDSKQGFEI